MRILSIETSCDETAVSIVEMTGDFPRAEYRVLSHALFSQVDTHREYGGVFPNVAKREHARTLVPMLKKALTEATLLNESPEATSDELRAQIETLLTREPGLYEDLSHFIAQHGAPDIDVIAVTHGPGLEPALWVGVNFAKALSLLWKKPVTPVNHMEGHIFASLFSSGKLADLSFPAIVLLVSGGHTELILMNDWGSYTRVGETRDDAAGEAFDKIARTLGLPYPGGPEISKLAEEARRDGTRHFITLPRPMLDSGDLDFSFSGLKTAVLYAVRDKNISPDERKALAREAEDAIVEVLTKKSIAAVKHYNAHSLIAGGGVIANAHLREKLKSATDTLGTVLYLSDKSIATDNAVMIALAASAHVGKEYEEMSARGNLALGR